MRIAKLKGAIVDCTKRVLSALLLQEKNYHKFKYSASVQIPSDMNGMLKGINKKSKGILGSAKTNNIVSNVKQRTLR